jgi:hypothetical protein
MKHENYEILNLFGYGLAKFDVSFVRDFGFKTKSSLYDYCVKLGIADTVGTVKNRQDLFDPFFNNDRKGWWQKGHTYLHRKIMIDGLFGDLNSIDYSNVVRFYIQEKFKLPIEHFEKISPLLKSKFSQLQNTGREAELFFINNFQNISEFQHGELEDARLLGDGYDFQIEVHGQFFLAEIKGLRSVSGKVRMTQKEFEKSVEYKETYFLVVICNLDESPKISCVADPVNSISFKKNVSTSTQTTYHSFEKNWAS